MDKPSDGIGTIKSTKILAVEGEDEKNFFSALLKYMKITGCDIRVVGGKNQFKNKFPALKKASGFYNADGSSSISHLAIIRDKDGDDAFDSIVDTLRRAGFTAPEDTCQFVGDNPEIGVFVMPGNTINGTMLEDLCLKTVENKPCFKCVEDFLSCVSQLESPPNNPSKAKAQVFLAAQPKIFNSVGLGAIHNYWDFDSPVLEELKHFLSHLK